MYLTDHSNARPAQKKTKWHPFVWYSNGLTIQYSNTGPIAIQPLFDHLNTELIRHSDLYCIENIYNSIPDLTWNKDIVWKLVSWLQDMLMGIQPNQVLAPHWNDVLKLWLETGLLGSIHKWRHKQRGSWPEKAEFVFYGWSLTKRVEATLGWLQLKMLMAHEAILLRQILFCRIGRWIWPNDVPRNL